MGAKYNNREFVVTWMNSKCKEDVMRNMRMTREAVNVKAKALRDMGVKLPDLPNAPKDHKKEVHDLNALIDREKKLKSQEQRPY